MGIADVRKSIESGAEGKASISNVTLSYKDGGSKQCLKFTYKLNIEGADPTFVEWDFPGTADPIMEALQQGQALAVLFDATP